MLAVVMTGPLSLFRLFSRVFLFLWVEGQGRGPGRAPGMLCKWRSPRRKGGSGKRGGRQASGVGKSVVVRLEIPGTRPQCRCGSPSPFPPSPLLPFFAVGTRAERRVRPARGPADPLPPDSTSHHISDVSMHLRSCRLATAFPAQTSTRLFPEALLAS